jgi:hypothetical protein
MPTTDRSIPPVIIVIVMASARIANSGNWNAIEVRFCTDRKRSGDRPAIRAKTATAMIASRNSGDWRSVGAVRVCMAVSPQPARAAARLACQAGTPVPIRIRRPMATDCHVDGMPTTIRLFCTSTISATPRSAPVSVP